MTKPEPTNPYQPPLSDPEDQSPSIAQLIGIVASSLIAGSIVFVATCTGIGMFLGPLLGPQALPVLLVGSLVAGGIRTVIVARNRIEKGRTRKNHFTAGTDEDLAG
jgi:hypothetical protein